MLNEVILADQGKVYCLGFENTMKLIVIKLLLI